MRWMLSKSILVGLVTLVAWVTPSLAHAQTADLAASLADQTSLGQFVRALDTAGLTDTLRGPGPYTVWAPTDAAFARLSSQARQRLQDPMLLKQVLQYHLAPGVVTAAQLIQVPNVQTLEGERVKISASAGVVSINASRVLQPDLPASNGIIHVIDALLIPPSQMALPNAGSAEIAEWPLALVVLGIALAVIGILLRVSSDLSSRLRQLVHRKAL